MKNSYKFAGLAIAVAITFGVVFSFAENVDQLTGRASLKAREVKSVTTVVSKDNGKYTEKKQEDITRKRASKKGEKFPTSPYVGTGVDSTFYPIIETYLGACNDPFGAPSCVVDDGYTTQDLAFGADEVVYTMRVKNTSNTMPMYMDKVHLEYFTSGLDTSVWSRTEWKIYESTAPNTVLTRGALFPSSTTKGYISFDWSYAGSLQNPVNKPPVIPAGGYQTYIVKAVVTDNAAGPSTNDYIQVRANDDFASTPVLSGTLQDARSVNSRFIWHDYSGNYFNEASTDLMDMWGSVPSATAQWRKRVWSAPAPVTLDIQENLFLMSNLPLENTYINADTAFGSETAYVGAYIFTPTAPVELNSVRLEVNASISSIYTNLNPTTCNDLVFMTNLMNFHINNFSFEHNFSTLNTSAGQIVVTGTTFASPLCTVHGYVDLQVPSFALVPNVANNFEIMANFHPMYISRGDEYSFQLQDADLHTVAVDTATGLTLTPAQITTSPAVLRAIIVDNNQFSIMNPVSAGAPWPITASQGQTDVLFGVFAVQNWSNMLSVTLNELVISDEIIAIANSVQPDITNIRLYEWDYALNQPIGAPLASGLDMIFGNTVTAQGLNLNFPTYGLSGSEKMLAVVGDISPSFTTDTGYDVQWDAGTAIDDNEIQIGLHVTGLTNPLTPSNPTVPFFMQFHQNMSSMNPFSGGGFLTNDITLGNLVDVQAAPAGISLTPPTISYDNGALVTSMSASSIGSMPVYRFVVTAGASDVEWLKVHFNITETAGMTGTSFRLYEEGQPMQLSPTAQPIAGELDLVLNTPQLIPAGQSVTYILIADVSVVHNFYNAQTLSIELSANGDTSPLSGNSSVMVVADFVWSDLSALGHSLFTADWYNGYNVQAFDVETVNIEWGVGYMTRTDLLSALFTAKSQPLVAGASGCTDTTALQEPIWATAINLGILGLPGGLCRPDDFLNRAEASSVLFRYANSVTNTVSQFTPVTPTFPDVLPAIWYYTAIESLNNAIPSGWYAAAGVNFLPGDLIEFAAGNLWVANLP